MTPKFHLLKIADVRKETSDTVSISFDVPAELSAEYAYISGQYLTLKATINGEEVRRSYSLCSAPHENELRVAVKQVPEGKFSTYANNEISVGIKMEVMTPTGNFVLNTNESNSETYVLFAAGSGITPVLSMAKSALNEEADSSVVLFYGNKDSNSIIFKKELDELKGQYNDRLNIVNILSRENSENALLNGRIDEAKACALLDEYTSTSAVKAIYICGPEEMIHSVKDGSISKGISEEKVHFELFTTPTTKNEAISLPTNSPSVNSNVTVIVDDEEYDFELPSTGDNILDVAQEEGADLPFACKGGVCCTCKAKIIEGSASMDINYALEPDEVEAGYILTCQAHPTSEKLVISFDE